MDHPVCRDTYWWVWPDRGQITNFGVRSCTPIRASGQILDRRTIIGPDLGHPNDRRARSWAPKRSSGNILPPQPDETFIIIFVKKQLYSRFEIRTQQYKNRFIPYSKSKSSNIKINLFPLTRENSGAKCKIGLGTNTAGMRIQTARCMIGGGNC